MAKILSVLAAILIGLGFLTYTAYAGQTLARCIVIDKGIHRLFLCRHGKIIKRIPVSLGIDSMSPKRHREDGSTPEGSYYVTYKKAKSRFYKFLGISYPNEVDAWMGLRAGYISLGEFHSIVRAISAGSPPPDYTALGGGIGIHGGGIYRNNGRQRTRDWTEGCIAVDDHAMDIIYAFCRLGDPVVILNSRHPFFDMVHPFGIPISIDKTLHPGYQREKYISRFGLDTGLGQVFLRLKEGADYSRSIEITVFGDSSGPPDYIIFDHNGDGKLGSRDRQIGTLDTITGIVQDPYTRLRLELTRALRRGRLLTYPGKWSLYLR
ncbi:MAG: L,D-transpeptidase family protein [Nitrospiraceae bacterium]|nr:L,D-transpeptidase family protein [Nitrospiraceae bacterium]